MGGINKREHLIETGQELIWAKGYDQCSIKDITTAAGLPKGSFYHYFESKEKFALEAMTDYLETCQETLPDQGETLDTLARLIDKRIEAVVQIQYARECYMSVMSHACTEENDSFRVEVLKGIEDSNQTMRILLLALKNKDLIKPSLKLDELMEFIDFAWRGARLKAKMLQSDAPLSIFKSYLFEFILKKD